MIDEPDMSDGRPLVEYRRPPPAFVRRVNPLLLLLLRSPAHRIVSGQLVVLTVTGRRTGRTYDVVVGRHDVPGGLELIAAGTWRRNLTGGAPVRILVAGRERSGIATLLEGPRPLAEFIHRLLQRKGVRAARSVAVAVRGSSVPSVDELLAGTGERELVQVRYTDT